MTKIALVTGASAGFGKAIAKVSIRWLSLLLALVV